jgi:hypothetical protein
LLEVGCDTQSCLGIQDLGTQSIKTPRNGLFLRKIRSFRLSLKENNLITMPHRQRTHYARTIHLVHSPPQPGGSNKQNNRIFIFLTLFFWGGGGNFFTCMRRHIGVADTLARTPLAGIEPAVVGGRLQEPERIFVWRTKNLIY